MSSSPIAENLVEARRWYAEELRVVAHVRNSRVVDAFASVPRERFFQRGPWQILDLAEERYWTTEDDDPRRLYHDVLVAIDPERRLNNGEPSLWARLFDRLAIRPSERVIQIGAGTGYYAAVLAEIVGRSGSVVAYEIDPALAAAAAANLRPWPRVQVTAADGCKLSEGQADVIVLFAGATHPLPAWLDRLAEGGRLLLPMTTARHTNMIARIERRGDGFDVKSLGWIGIYACSGARDSDAERKLVAAMGKGWPPASMSLRRDRHAETARCWLHGSGYCFQRDEIEPAAKAN